MKTTAIAISLVALAAGCVSPRYVDQRDLFRAKHPAQAEHYVLLAPTSVEYMEYAGQQEHSTLAGAIKSMRRVENLPEEAKPVLRRLEKMSEFYRKEPDWHPLRGRLQPDDSVYFFQFKKQGYDDAGFLVLRDGDIVFRKPIASSWQAEEDKPEGTEIDGLEHPPGHVR
jgi:hypothetical protein